MLPGTKSTAWQIKKQITAKYSISSKLFFGDKLDHMPRYMPLTKHMYSKEYFLPGLFTMNDGQQRDCTINIKLSPQLKTFMATFYSSSQLIIFVNDEQKVALKSLKELKTSGY